MQYQLLCVDLDGTLLNEEKKLPYENREAIRSAWKQGMEICIASGRSALSALEYLEKLGVDGSVVALNGGLIISRGKELARFALKDEEVLGVLDIAEQTGVRVYLNSGEKSFVLIESPDLGIEMKKSQMEGFNKMRAKIRSGEEKILKISLQDEVPLRLENVRTLISRRVAVSLAKSDVDYVDVFPKDQSKWSGISILLKYLNIGQKTCVCFGDNENDFEMVKCAGLGIAMGNADLKLKKEADFVTLKNDEVGVAYGIRTWILASS